MSHYLIADARERAVTPFLEDAIVHAKLSNAGSRLVLGRQVNTGDYLICQHSRAGDPPSSTIRACIERKTLHDFAASFKDGRHANIQKMRDLRTQTGCQLYYVIEGPAFPSPSRRISQIPYASILTAITNLMVRDSVMVIQTENELHSAKRLADLITAFDKLPAVQASPALPASEKPPASPPVPVVPITTGGAAETALESLQIDAEMASPTIPECLTTPMHQSDADAVISMWSQLRGVSAVLGKIISQKFSVADIAAGLVSDTQIKQLRTATGRAINADAIKSLRAIGGGDAEAAIRTVSGIRGISRPTATLILTSIGGLVALSDIDRIAECAEIQLPHGNRTVKLGAVRATRIQSLLNYVAR